MSKFKELVVAEFFGQIFLGPELTFTETECSASCKRPKQNTKSLVDAYIIMSRTSKSENVLNWRVWEFVCLLCMYLHTCQSYLHGSIEVLCISVRSVQSFNIPICAVPDFLEILSFPRLASLFTTLLRHWGMRKRRAVEWDRKACRACRGGGPLNGSSETCLLRSNLFSLCARCNLGPTRF